MSSPDSDKGLGARGVAEALASAPDAASSAHKTSGAGSRGGAAALLVLSHVSWRAIWQRNQQTMSRLAARRKVLYLTPLPLHVAARDRGAFISGTVRDGSGVVAATPLVLPGESRWPLVRAINRALLMREIRLRLREEGIASFITWTYFPAWPDMVGSMEKDGEIGAVYDIQDNYEQFPWAPRGATEMERALLRKVGLVFTGTHSLWEKKSAFHDNIHFFPCGVEFDHFTRQPSKSRPFPADRPILGYYGYIDSRKIDLDLLDFVAARHPEWVVWMVGPTHREHCRAPRSTNVIYSPAVPYAELPNVLGWFDVALLPYAVNDLTADMNPTKTLEYLAARKPVVSTAIPDMVELFKGVIPTARSQEEFLALCEQAVKTPESFPLDAGVARARALSWDQVVAEMEEHLDSLTRRRAEGHVSWEAR